jgi:hypothetical protein
MNPKLVSVCAECHWSEQTDSSEQLEYELPFNVIPLIPVILDS